MERYMAVDNVCAWPNLTRLPDGSIVATIFNQPTHGGWEGDVECWASEDEGRTWRLRGTPAPHEPATNRMNVAAGLARDGSLIVLASGWSRRPAPGTAANPHNGECLPIWTCRSDDGGRTWERSASLPAPADEAGRVVIPFGDIVQVSDGSLGVSVYGGSPDPDSSAWWYASMDDGRTWTMRAVMRDGNTTETTPLVLGDGRILAAARTCGYQHLDLLSSDDHGATWQTQGPLTLGGQHPGHLLELKDGRLLLTYGIRNIGLYGVGVMISADQGKTWQSPRVLVDFETATDGGYPASMEMPDGVIVTAYYCNGIPAHQRYHMGVARWPIEP